MKRLIVTYGRGYGSHKTDFEIEDDTSPEEIEELAKDVALDRFDCSFKVEG